MICTARRKLCKRIGGVGRVGILDSISVFIAKRDPIAGSARYRFPGCLDCGGRLLNGDFARFTRQNVEIQGFASAVISGKCYGNGIFPGVLSCCGSLKGVISVLYKNLSLAVLDYNLRCLGIPVIGIFRC